MAQSKSDFEQNQFITDIIRETTDDNAKHRNKKIQGQEKQGMKTSRTV
jgi:hypothetical protein